MIQEGRKPAGVNGGLSEVVRLAGLNTAETIAPRTPFQQSPSHRPTNLSATPVEPLAVSGRRARDLADAKREFAMAQADPARGLGRAAAASQAALNCLTAAQSDTDGGGRRCWRRLDDILSAPRRRCWG